MTSTAERSGTGANEGTALGTERAEDATRAGMTRGPVTPPPTPSASLADAQAMTDRALRMVSGGAAALIADYGEASLALGLNLAWHEDDECATERATRARMLMRLATYVRELESVRDRATADAKPEPTFPCMECGKPTTGRLCARCSAWNKL